MSHLQKTTNQFLTHFYHCNKLLMYVVLGILDNTKIRYF